MCVQATARKAVKLMVFGQTSHGVSQLLAFGGPAAKKKCVGALIKMINLTVQLFYGLQTLYRHDF